MDLYWIWRQAEGGSSPCVAAEKQPGLVGGGYFFLGGPLVGRYEKAGRQAGGLLFLY